MVELVALKVKIGLKSVAPVRGNKLQITADYPDFNLLPIVAASGLDWAHYVDLYGGWHYDKTSGHAEETADSSAGQQWGMLLMPEQFADEAEAAFPKLCAKMTQADAVDFFDNKAHAHERDQRDVGVIESLKAERDLLVARGGDTTAIDAKIERALDPDDNEPGVRRNYNKTFAEYSARRGVTIKDVQK